MFQQHIHVLCHKLCHCLQCFDTVGWAQEGHPAGKKMGGWRRWALVSPDGVAPAGQSVSLPLLIFPCTIKSGSSLLASAHPGWSRKKGHKTVVVVVLYVINYSCKYVNNETQTQIDHFNSHFRRKPGYSFSSSS